MNNFSKEIFNLKYRYNNEDWQEFCKRISTGCFPNDKEKANKMYEFLYNKKLSPAGRILYGLNTNRKNVTFSNCYVIPIIEDSMKGIMESAKNAALIMKAGGGVGYNFSVLRPKGAKINSSGETSTGPIEFMKIFDQITKTIIAGGNRRGANIGVINIWHPSVLEFINSKREEGVLSQFNISIAIDDKFMKALENDEEWILEFPDTTHEKYNEIWGSKELELFYKEFYNIYFDKEKNDFDYNKIFIDKYIIINNYRKAYEKSLNGDIYRWKSLGLPTIEYKRIKAKELYNMIMKANYNYAEPGVLFIDTINKYNNLYYCENITSTNPCVTGDTLISVADGRGAVSIKQLAKEGKDISVYSINRKTGKIEIKIMRRPRLTGKNKKILKVILDNGSEIKCTENHKFLVYDEDYNIIEVEAKDLKPNMSIVSKNKYLYQETEEKINEIKEKYNLDCIFENNDLYVIKKCEYCGNEFKVKWNSREISYCSISCGIKSRNERKRKNALLQIYNYICDYIQKNNILPAKLELDKFIKIHTKYNNIRFLKVTNLKDFYKKIFNDIDFSTFNNTELSRKEYAKKLIENGYNYNHKVVKVEFYGYEDVYNGTVDENHNFGIVISNFDINKKLNKGEKIKVEQIFTAQCGEQPLSSYASCNLGCVNLSNFVYKSFSEESYFDFNELKEAVSILTEALDNILDINYYPLYQQKIEVILKRPIGVGITGLGDCLAKMKIKYGDEESKELFEKIMKTLATSTYSKSIELAKEKDSFILFEPEKYIESKYIKEVFDDKIKEDIKSYGIRNCRLLTIAPTGTISIGIFDNCSNGIEPIFMLEYKRRYLQPDNTWKTEIVENNAWYTYKLLKKSNEIPDYFITATKIDSYKHIDIMKIAQKYVDASISKTINIPEDYSFEKFKDIYIYAYKSQLKGCTTYRPNNVIKPIMKDKEEDKEEYKKENNNSFNFNIFKKELLPIEEAKRYSVRYKNAKIYINVSHDEDGNPLEVYVSPSIELGYDSKGNFDQSIFMEQLSLWQCLCRIISLALRYSIPVNDIVKQLNKSSYSIVTLPGILYRILSNYPLKEYIADDEYELSEKIDETNKIFNEIKNEMNNIINNGNKFNKEKNLCPLCNNKLIKESGCNKCINCGYSTCG